MMQQPVDRPQVLNLESRRRIHDFLTARPGSHLREVARSLDLPLGTALYHLDYLVSHDLIVVRRDGRYKRFFVKHMLGRVEKDYVSVFHHDVPRRIVTALLAFGKRTQRELCRDVEVSRSTLSFHVNNLVDSGILRCQDGWPENTYFAADPETATRMLLMFRQRFKQSWGDRFADRIPALGSAPFASADGPPFRHGDAQPA